MKKTVCFVLVVLILMGLAGCTGNKKEDEKNPVVIGKVEEDVFTIKTDYATLKYPNVWKDMVTVKVAGDTVSFSYTKTGTKVFDIIFNKNEGYLIGTIKDGEKNIEVYINSYYLESTEEDFETLCAIQNDVNVIINHLSRDYKFDMGA